MSESRIYGLLAEFSDPDALVRGAEEMNRAGYTRMESYSPFGVEGISRAFRFRPTAVAVIFLVCAVLGAAGGYVMQYDASVISYPLNVGGRPLHSWPSFIPITFEMGVLGGVLGGIFGMLVLNRLPRYSHPVSNVERFRAASSDAFFLCIEAADPRFHPHLTADLLRHAGAIEVSEVPE
jgi:phage shock protein PspC (stress-responsive transcriptional regulator)